MKILVFIVTILFVSQNVFSQGDSLLILKEKELASMLNDLRSAKTDKDKFQKNKILKEKLEETINLLGVFDYPFESLKTMGTIKSDDDLVRLFNWNIELDDHTQKYYCYILRYDVKKKKYIVNELIDNSVALPMRPDEVLDAKNWYGALYYKLIPIEKGNRTFYTVLGMDANNSMSNVKIIDVLYFTGNTVRLGSPIFKNKEETVKRVFFEYSKKAYMSLKYEEQYNRIIFDHLSPETPGMEGYYAYYVPDFSYDSYVLYKNKWYLQEEVVAVNKKSREKVKVYIQNKRTGKLEVKEVDNDWVDPSDEKAAAGPNIHVARTPDGELEEAKKYKFSLKKLFKNKRPNRGRTPQSYSNLPVK